MPRRKTSGKSAKAATIIRAHLIVSHMTVALRFIPTFVSSEAKFFLPAYRHCEPVADTTHALYPTRHALSQCALGARVDGARQSYRSIATFNLDRTQVCEAVTLVEERKQDLIRQFLIFALAL